MRERIDGIIIPPSFSSRKSDAISKHVCASLLSGKFEFCFVFIWNKSFVFAERSPITKKRMEELDEKGDIRNVPKHIIKELIAVYKAHPALWQIKNKDFYANRTLKYKGHQALVNVWKKYDADADIKMVKNKIQSLRGSFRKELKKIQNSQKSGSGTEDIYKSQLWYFSLLTFLTEHEQPTESVDNCTGPELTQKSETHQDNDNGTANTNEEKDVNNSPCTAAESNSNKYAPAKKKKKVEEEEKLKFLKACTDALGDKETESDAFGKFISKKLDKVDNSEQRMYAESLITKVANYAFLNKLTEFSDVMGNYSSLRDSNTPMTNYSSSHSEMYQPAIKSPEAPNTPITNYSSSHSATHQPAIKSPKTPLSRETSEVTMYNYEDVANYETIHSENDSV